MPVDWSKFHPKYDTDLIIRLIQATNDYEKTSDVSDIVDALRYMAEGFPITPEPEPPEPEPPEPEPWVAGLLKGLS